MNKNNVVIITTRWMSVIEDEEGQKMPLHCHPQSPFKGKNISNLDKILSFFESHQLDSFGHDGILVDKFYYLDDGKNFVYIIPCLKKGGCSDPEGWIQALVSQFSEPGDIVRMMIHASSDLNTGPQVITSFAGITDRDLCIRAFAHMGGDVANKILLSDSYKTGITASAIFRYIDNLCKDIGKIKKNVKDAWQDYWDGDGSLEDLLTAYDELLTAVECDVRGLTLPSKGRFKEMAEGIDENPEYSKYIEQIIAKF